MNRMSIITIIPPQQIEQQIQQQYQHQQHHNIGHPLLLSIIQQQPPPPPSTLPPTPMNHQNMNWQISDQRIGLNNNNNNFLMTAPKHLYNIYSVLSTTTSSS